ncbi:MAG: SDR family oxidoreductase [Bacteroidales bacterium]|nr:SDR family oxidoreductase [Bacteroidales bacterium]MCR4856874.1 SDR family oxidoreductase [Bacteroidales bacterium]
MATCVITGIGSGIGKATAIMLAQKGFFNKYALIGRNDDDMIQTKMEMAKYMPEEALCLYHIDLSYPENIPQLVEKIDAEQGNIMALLNIAGYTDPQPLLSTSLESFELTYKVNVYAPFMFMRECVKYMRKNGGKILNVASTAGMTPRPGWLSYASSKAAVISMSETLTSELSEYGIMVYCVSPGRCATKLRRRLAPDEDPTTIMQPEEVAEVICNLINPQELCLDGQNIVIRKQMKR